MTDWNSICQGFNTYQDSDKTFSESCATVADKPLSEALNDIIQLSGNIKPLNDRIVAAGQSYTPTGSDKALLKQSMKVFCCIKRKQGELQTKYSEAKQDHDVAKQRVESIRNPPADVSYLGTFVPFGRPLRSDSVPVLLSISLVFLILALGMLLNLGNIQLAYVGARGYGPGIFEQIVMSFRETSWMVLLLTVVGSVGVAAGIYYGIKKTHPEWLGK
jgi:hypothetical protein